MSDLILAAASAASRCVGDLPDDVVSEILVRVPDVVSLFRCTIVCRRWRRLVSDPAFVRRRTWSEDGRSDLIGFFVQPQELVTETDASGEFTRLVPTDGPLFVPAPDSAALGPGPLTSFVRDDAGILDRARPLAARDGLLLLRLSPRPGDKKRLLRLCVCDLLTGRRDLLRPLDGDGLVEEGVGGYAVLTAADYGTTGAHRPAHGYSTFFQVLLAGTCYMDLQVYLVRFSSDSAASQTWSWRCLPELSAGPYGNLVAAVTLGAAHWIFIGTGPNGDGMQILDVSINTGHVGLTEVPFHEFILHDWSNAWLFPSVDGRLSLLALDDYQLRIWSRQDGDEGGTEVWNLTQTIPVGTELGLSGVKPLSMVCIGEKSGTMLVLDESDPDHPCVLDLRSRSTTMVTGWKRSFNWIHHVPAVPYEMNWSEFFASRLGVQL